MSAVATKVNVDNLYASKTDNGKTVEEILKEHSYPTEKLKSMYSFQQILELNTIREILESQNVEMPTVTYK